MSTNCVVCLRAPRVAPSLKCAKCEAIDFDNHCAAVEMRYPSVKAFLDTWGANCGASRKVFTGHLVKMLMEFFKDACKLAENAKEKDGELAEPLLALLSLGGDNVEQDALLAFRFCYYVKALPLLSDATYDRMESAFLERCPDDSPLMEPGSDKEGDYPDNVRALALYLLLTNGKR